MTPGFAQGNVDRRVFFRPWWIVFWIERVACTRLARGQGNGFCLPASRENRPTRVGADDSYCEPTH